MDEKLQHHGIRGMKWGVRRYQNKDGTLTPRGKKRYNAEMEKLKKEEQVLKNKQRTKAKLDRLMKKQQDVDELKKKVSGKSEDNDAKKTSNSPKAKTVKEMTDEELMYKVNRLRLEQTYTQLTSTPESKESASAGKKFVNDLLKTVGEKTVKSVGDAVADKTQKAIRKQLGLDKEDPLAKLKKEAEKAGYEMKIRANKKGALEWEEEKKKSDEDD